MEHYVTLFDLGFARQGLALHASLVEKGGEFCLWVICMDTETETLLSKLDSPSIRTIPLEEIETDALRSLKSSRTRAEYCWTLTPFSFDAVFARDPAVERVTYVDADVALVADPSPAFEEFEGTGAAVQITEHAYSPEHDQTATSGRYCVQFMTMVRDASDPVRSWWQERCIEWCFARFEDGKFGDQKYLDDWPSRFGALVHVARPQGRFQGPWNASRFPYSEAITYHFHGLRLGPDRLVKLVDPIYSIPKPHLAHIYTPYLRAISSAADIIVEVTGIAPAPQVNGSPAVARWHLVGRRLKRVRRRMQARLRPQGHDFVRLPDGA